MRIRLITMPRTKATYLMKAIISANNPLQLDINSDLYNEPYNNDRPDPDLAIEWMKSDTNAVIKHHIRHLVANDVYDSKQAFQQECELDWLTVVLLRRDLFAAATSYARSRISNEWHSYTNKSVYIPPEFFNKCLIALWGSVTHIKNNVNNLTYDKIIYSDDFTGTPSNDIKEIIPNYSKEIFTDSKPRPENTITNINELREYSQQITLPDNGVMIDKDLIITI